MFSWKESSLTAKLIVVFTAVLLVSLGMCGLTMFGNVGNVQFAIVEALLVVVSAIGLVVTPIVAMINNAVTNRSKQPQTLFDDREKKK